VVGFATELNMVDGFITSVANSIKYSQRFIANETIGYSTAYCMFARFHWSAIQEEKDNSSNRV